MEETYIAAGILTAGITLWSVAVVGFGALTVLGLLGTAWCIWRYTDLTR